MIKDLIFKTRKIFHKHQWIVDVRNCKVRGIECGARGSEIYEESHEQITTSCKICGETFVEIKNRKRF